MSRLIKNCVLFVIIGIILFGPICYISHRQYRQALEAPVFHFNNDINILVAGDSHTEAAIDPKWFPHSQNIAKSAENYFYTYYKLRHFLDKNPQIKLVVLGCSWHNFAQNYQEPFLFGDETNRTALYFPLLDQTGKSTVRSWKYTYLVPWGKYTLGLPLKVYDERLLQRKLFGARLSREDFDYFGGYQVITSSNIDPIRINKKLSIYFSDGSTISPYMVQYLDGILKMCADRNVNIILINTPVHELYRRGVPPRMIHELDSLQARLKSQYANMTYIDYSDLKLDAENYYDGDHVNQAGAEKVTRKLVTSGLIKN